MRPALPASTEPATLHLHIAARETVAEFRVPGAEGQRFVLLIGCDTLWPTPGHGGRPSPLDLENAIQVVEDQIERLHRHVPTGSRLVVAAQVLAPLQHEGSIQGADHEAISLATVERWYQALAARAMGAPSAHGTGFDDPTGDALVLILREFMHHLGFDAVHLEA